MSGPRKIYATLRSVGFSATSAIVGTSIVLAESGGNPNAVGDGGTSFGWWQIHLPAHADVSKACAVDPVCASKVAYQISGGGRNWVAWSTYNHGANRQFLDDARRASKRSGNTNGTGANPVTGNTWVPTARAAAFNAAIRLRFPSASFLGTCSCRHIIPHDGGTSSTYSEHSWCNADDWGGSSETMQRIMAYAERHRSLFGINNIIGPGSAVNSVHVDFLPSHAGQIPPCASGDVSTTVPNSRDLTGSNPCPPGQAPLTLTIKGKAQTTCVDVKAAAGAVPNGATDAITSPFAFLGKIPLYLEVAAGGVLILAGLGVVLYGSSGRANKAATIVLSGAGGALSRPGGFGSQGSNADANAAYRARRTRETPARSSSGDDELPSRIDTRTPEGKAQAKRALARGRVATKGE